MSRRVSLPAADDLFRPSVPAQPRTARTAGGAGSTAGAGSRVRQHQAPEADATETRARRAEQREGAAPERKTQSGKAQGGRGRRTSGRVRHDEKMTVYVTAEELLELEHARLTLRRDQGLAVDRGRLVREAVAMALADLEARGDDSEIVRRLLAR